EHDETIEAPTPLSDNFASSSHHSIWRPTAWLVELASQPRTRLCCRVLHRLRLVPRDRRPFADRESRRSFSRLALSTTHQPLDAETREPLHIARTRSLHDKGDFPLSAPYNAAAASPTASSAPGGRRSSPSPASSTSG